MINVISSGLLPEALPTFGANMGEVVRFVPKSERERASSIGEARATYDSIIPPADPMGEQQDDARFSHAFESGKS